MSAKANPVEPAGRRHADRQVQARRGTSREWAVRRAGPIALALARNLARLGVVAPIIGPKTAVQLKDNLAALDVDLPAEAVERIDAVSEPCLPYPHDFMRWRGKSQR